MKNIHHIIPKHMGGTDDPKNLVELTVEEHAEAHKQLYEKYGLIEDYLAWKGLSGQLQKEEILKELYTNNGIKWGKSNTGKTPWNKGLTKNTDNRLAKQSEKLKGIPKSESTKQAMKRAAVNKNTENIGRYKRTDEIKLKLKEATKSQFSTEEQRKRHSEIIKSIPHETCIHCGFSCNVGNLRRYHSDKCKHKPS